MSLNIPSGILVLKGQKINKIEFNTEERNVLIQCRRDKRKAVIDPITGCKGRINRLVKRKSQGCAYLRPALLDRINSSLYQ